MPDEDLSLPIFHDDSLVVELLVFTNATADDAETQAWVQRTMNAREAVQRARSDYTKAERVGRSLPKGVLADLKAAKARAEAECDTVSEQLRDAADARLRRARRRRADILNAALERPAHVDPVSDKLDRSEWLEKLEQLAPDERALMIKTAAKEGSHPELVRAALTAKAPPWPTPTWQPLLDENVAQEAREWIYARKAPETVTDIRAAWRLRRLAYDLDYTRAGYPSTGQPPSISMLNMRRPLDGA
jgi:hypothetical protein